MQAAVLHLMNAIPAVAKVGRSLQKATEKTGAQIVSQSIGRAGSSNCCKCRLGRLRYCCPQSEEASKVGYGYDALTETYVDMISAGIVDPTKVTRSALQNAASVAAMVLTTRILGCR